MGIFRGNKKGWQCSKNEDGSQTCTRFEVDKSQKVATGTVVNVAVDPSTCQRMITGDMNSILDDEMEDIDKIAKSMESGCRKGIN